MLMLSLDSLSMSKSSPNHPYCTQCNANRSSSQNPAVMSRASQCFTFVAQALEAETLQGNTAQRAIAAARKLVQTAGLDANQLLNGLPPETQQTVRAMFG